MPQDLKFVEPSLSLEFYEGLHEKVRTLVMALADWSRVTGVRTPEVTCIHRKATDPLEKRKKNGPGWHTRWCAIDLRNCHYTPWEKTQVREWIEDYCKADRSNWELVFEDHGTGPHFHVAYKDSTRNKVGMA